MDQDGEERLREFLKAAIEKRRPGLSSRELARRCERYGFKVNESYVSQFLSGARRSISFKALRPISSVLGVSYLQLLLLAGYISEDDLHAAQFLEIEHPKATNCNMADVDWNVLSETGRRLMVDYFEFVRVKHPNDSL
jgi:transcriptional regulator with XRE-family HTH domain